MIFIFVILYFYPFLIQILKLTWFQIKGSCFRLGKAHRWCNLHFTCPPRGRHTDYHKFGNKIFGLCGCDMLWLTNLAPPLADRSLIPTQRYIHRSYVLWNHAFIKQESNSIKFTMTKVLCISTTIKNTWKWVKSTFFIMRTRGLRRKMKKKVCWSAIKVLF